MRHQRLTLLYSTLAVSCLVAFTPANGDLVGDQAVVFNWTSAGAVNNGMRGWKFSTNNDIKITALGIFDHFNPNGLVGSHEIVVWDSNQQIVANATVPEGVMADKIGRSRYVKIAPTVLAAGNEFVIAAQYLAPADQDWWATDFSLLEFDPSINFIEGRWLNTDDLVIPTNASANPILGANFLVASVPEPSLVCLMAWSAGPLLMHRRRK